MKTEIILFDNYGNYDIDEIRKELQNEYDEDVKITDDFVYEYISSIEQEDWELCKCELERVFNEFPAVIVRGSLGTWRGNFDVAQRFDDIDKAINACVKNCDYIKVKQTARGLVVIESCHHDGSNNFEIKGITEKGENVYNNWLYSNRSRLSNLYDYELFNIIWNDSHYSKNVKHIDY